MCCGVTVDAVNHHLLHPTSILDVYKVFKHLDMLWMGIWVHPYTVIPVQVILENWGKGEPKCAVVSRLRLSTTDLLHPTSILDV